MCGFDSEATGESQAQGFFGLNIYIDVMNSPIVIEYIAVVF